MLQRRACFTTVAPKRAGTRLGQYLEACGANWGGEAAEVHDVVASQDSRSFSWRVDLPVERLGAIRRGDVLESPPFELMQGDGRGVQVRFQFSPKGDLEASGDDRCSLWLCTNSREQLPVRLRLGTIECTSGASDFCRLEDVMRDGAVEVSLTVECERPADTQGGRTKVEQSLQLRGLEFAEWRLFNAADLLRRGQLVSSPPFRFHHVLLGDMYLELQPEAPHPGYAAIFFRCRVPTMRLKVQLESGGGSFSKTIEAIGRASGTEDLAQGRFLSMNMDVPTVFETDGSLLVRASLEQVVTIPPALRDMIPRLDERVNWPKRL